MWIARDRDGETYLYELQPIKREGYFINNRGDNTNIYLGNKEVYPEVTWENSPKQVELKIID